MSVDGVDAVTGDEISQVRLAPYDWALVLTPSPERP